MNDTILLKSVSNIRINFFILDANELFTQNERNQTTKIEFLRMKDTSGKSHKHWFIEELSISENYYIRKWFIYLWVTSHTDIHTQTGIRKWFTFKKSHLILIRTIGITRIFWHSNITKVLSFKGIRQTRQLANIAIKAKTWPKVQ